MNLKEINSRLYELIPLLIEAGEKLSEVSERKERRKSQLYLLEDVMGMKNAEMRDAYVRGVLDEEGISEDFSQAMGQYKKFSIEKELLVEISKNLRIINV